MPQPQRLGFDVAVVQDASVILDRDASVEKTIDLAGQAAANGAQLVLFPEAFIPGYPRGLSFGAVVGSRSKDGRALFRRYAENAVTVPGPETERLGETARDLGIHHRGRAGYPPRRRRHRARCRHQWHALLHAPPLGSRRHAPQQTSQAKTDR